MKYTITYRNEITTDIEAENKDEAIRKAVDEGTWEFFSGEGHNEYFEVVETEKN